MSLCGEPDRPEVQKHVDDLDNNLLAITGEFDRRSRTLEEALERTMHFQDHLMVGGRTMLFMFSAVGCIKSILQIISLHVSLNPSHLILYDDI